MKISSVIALTAAAFALLMINTATLCSPHVSVNTYLRLADENASAFVYHSNRAVLSYTSGTVTLTPAENLPLNGKVESYMGVKIIVNGNEAQTILNGVEISGNLALVKACIKAALSGKNMLNLLRSAGLSARLDKVESLYILRKNYCPCSNNLKVVLVKKAAKGYDVHVYYHGKLTDLHTKNIKMAEFYLTKTVRRVLTFTVYPSDLRPRV